MKTHNLCIWGVCVCISVTKSCLTLLRPYRMQPIRLLCPWDSSGKNTGVGCHFLLQGIFWTQALNLHLLHWQTDSLPLSHVGSPHILMLRGIIFPIADLRYLKDYKSFSFPLFLFPCLFPLVLPFLISSFLYSFLSLFLLFSLFLQLSRQSYCVKKVLLFIYESINIRNIFIHAYVKFLFLKFYALLGEHKN